MIKNLITVRVTLKRTQMKDGNWYATINGKDHMMMADTVIAHATSLEEAIKLFQLDEITHLTLEWDQNKIIEAE